MGPDPQMGMDLNDRAKVRQHVMRKLASFYPDTPERMLHEKTIKFEQKVFSASRNKPEYLRKIAEGLTNVERLVSASRGAPSGITQNIGGVNGNHPQAYQFLMQDMSHNYPGLIQAGSSQRDASARLRATQLAGGLQNQDLAGFDKSFNISSERLKRLSDTSGTAPSHIMGLNPSFSRGLESNSKERPVPMAPTHSTLPPSLAEDFMKATDPNFSAGRFGTGTDQSGQAWSEHGSKNMAEFMRTQRAPVMTVARDEHGVVSSPTNNDARAILNSAEGNAFPGSGNQLGNLSAGDLGNGMDKRIGNPNLVTRDVAASQKRILPQHLKDAIAKRQHLVMNEMSNSVSYPRTGEDFEDRSNTMTPISANTKNSGQRPTPFQKDLLMESAPSDAMDGRGKAGGVAIRSQLPAAPTAEFPKLEESLELLPQSKEAPQTTMSSLEKKDSDPMQSEIFWKKLESMQEKYKKPLDTLLPYIKKVQEKQTNIEKRDQFMRHLNDCTNILNLKQMSSLPNAVTLELLDRAEKFIHQVITVYSDWMKRSLSQTSHGAGNEGGESYEVRTGQTKPIDGANRTSSPECASPIEAMMRQASPEPRVDAAEPVEFQGDQTISSGLPQDTVGHAMNRSAAGSRTQQKPAPVSPEDAVNIRNDNSSNGSPDSLEAGLLDISSKVQQSVNIAVSMTSRLGKHVDDEIGRTKMERVQSTRASLTSREYGLKPSYFTGFQNCSSNPALKPVTARKVFECSVTRGLKVASADYGGLKTNLYEPLRCWRMIQAEIAAALSLTGPQENLNFSIGEFFGHIVVKCNISGSGLVEIPCLTMEIPKNYVRASLLSYEFEAFGCDTSVVQGVLERFKQSASDAFGSDFRSITRILDLWLREVRGAYERLQSSYMSELTALQSEMDMAD